MDFATEKGGRNFPFSHASPPRPPAASANRPKSPTQHRVEPSPRATMENGVREEPGGGGGFASSGPGRGRGKGGQTRKWAPGSAVEPTGHPFKHALKVEDDRNVVPDVELLDDSGGAGGMTTLGASSEEADESEDEQGNGPW
jgi:hypothetical protein